MAIHSASVTVFAPLHQVFQLFSHFNDYPKFMNHVKEATYVDDERSHWVVDIAGHHEWDAVNENWTGDTQIGWRSTDGLDNSGTVRFEAISGMQTLITVDVEYDAPAGILGDIGEALGVGKRFEEALQRDLDHFASMLHQSPPGALDPSSSNYLFHSDSAAAKRETTPEQDATMRATPASPI